jgi:AcrR family transcriptional regulator
MVGNWENRAMEEDRRTRKKDRTRQALLGGALALFAERGIYEPSIEEITARADVGKGTFYQYFDSREVLIAELVQNGFTLLLAEVALQLENAGEGADPFPTILVSHQYFSPCTRSTFFCFTKPAAG